MSYTDQDIKRLHFVGIGGIGMSGIAEILHQQGYTISGSDLNENSNVKRLRNLGVNIFIGHHVDNIKNADAIVVSAAIKQDNPEVVEARKKNILIASRADMLAELMRSRRSIAISGTHGKTTTTSITAFLLSGANLDPTIINGGIMNSIGTNARLGESDIAVVEADESDGSFQDLPCVTAVVTNIDPEHMAYYKTEEALKEAFIRFIKRIPFYGLAVVCGDNINVKDIIKNITNRRILTYGFDRRNDIELINYHSSKKGVFFDLKNNVLNQTFKNFFIPSHGKHNALNATAALCVGMDMGININTLKETLADFPGVKRRFTLVGNINDVYYIDDYAHHPTEIKATIETAKEKAKGKVIVVLQPHRYSRLKGHFKEFVFSMGDADKVFITPVYEAGENFDDEYNHQTLCKSLCSNGIDAFLVKDESALEKNLQECVQKDDCVVFMGAGDITHWSYNIVERMKESV